MDLLLFQHSSSSSSLSPHLVPSHPIHSADPNSSQAPTCFQFPCANNLCIFSGLHVVCIARLSARMSLLRVGPFVVGTWEMVERIVQGFHWTYKEQLGDFVVRIEAGLGSRFQTVSFVRTGHGRKGSPWATPLSGTRVFEIESSRLGGTPVELSSVVIPARVLPVLSFSCGHYF